MPACGSEGACLQGLWTSSNAPNKSSLASAQCLGPPVARAARARRQLPQPRPSYQERLAQSLFRLLYRLLTYSVLGPAVWLSGWLWLWWLLLQLPLKGLRLALGLLLPATGARARTEAGRRAGGGRCVLVSGGSTVQAVQLARSLSRLGARVVVCEREGLLGLARFSRACASFHALPRSPSAAEYASALRDIVLRERVDAYVPVSADGLGAYYDGLAKPHLERLGCECLVPGAAEVARLDDPLELLRRAQALGLATPRHWLLPRLGDAVRLYAEAGGRLARAHYALPAGPAGLRPRPAPLRLPASALEFERLLRARAAAEEWRRAWLVLRDPGGPHFITCTTLRDSRPVANVTCRRRAPAGGSPARLLPEERPEVERWLERFFSRGFPGAARVDGHLSFRLAASEARPDELVAIGCRVGVGLAYLSQPEPEAHARLLISRPVPEPGAARLLTRTCRHRLRPTARMSPGPAEARLDAREALLLYWDPLPYCVYCYLQLPFRRIVELLGAQQTQLHQPPLAVVQ